MGLLCGKCHFYQILKPRGVGKSILRLLSKKYRHKHSKYGLDTDALGLMSLSVGER